MKIKLLVLSLIVSINGFGQHALTFNDTRYQTTTPSSYTASFEPHFKFGSVIGLSEYGMNPYYAVLGLRAWASDNTGGKAHELAFSNDNQIFFRSGYSPTWEGWRKLLSTDANGNVGIGTTSPDSKLTVAGNIHSREVKVTINAGADFVFEDSYRLEKLENLERFIKANKHLPEIVSAEEMKMNGIELGKMNIKLLQKIEELTLYVIEQNKRLSEQQKEINHLKFKL